MEYFPDSNKCDTCDTFYFHNSEWALMDSTLYIESVIFESFTIRFQFVSLIDSTIPAGRIQMFEVAQSVYK
jgi:hypothetical protein